MNPQEIASVIEAITKNLAAVKGMLIAKAEERLPSLLHLEQELAKRAEGPLYEELSRVSVLFRKLISTSEEQIHQLHFGVLAALEQEVGGLAKFLKLHGLQVEEEFVKAFNAMAAHFGAQPIHPDSVAKPEPAAIEVKPRAKKPAPEVAPDQAV